MRRQAGFTLIEVLVAITIMALMAVISWRGLDGMVRAQSQTKSRADAVLTLQAGLMQWRSDLDNIIQFSGNGDISPMDWNGRVLRVTRRNTTNPTQGTFVVAWSQRDTGDSAQWLRWQSPPVRTRGELRQFWEMAGQWAQNPGDVEKRSEIAVYPVTQWQVLFYRDNAWTNALSSDASAGPITVLPDGVRLILTLPQGQALGGALTLDWISPLLSGGKAA